jgi:hypothetical protein
MGPMQDIQGLFYVINISKHNKFGGCNMVKTISQTFLQRVIDTLRQLRLVKREHMSRHYEHHIIQHVNITISCTARLITAK